MNFLIKGVIGVTVMIWVRWTLPRLRIDQVITTCLKYCVPIAAVCFIGAMFWTIYDIPFINDLAPHRGRTRAEVREGRQIRINNATGGLDNSDAREDGEVASRGVEGGEG